MTDGPVSWSCWIHRLHLCRRVILVVIHMKQKENWKLTVRVAEHFHPIRMTCPIQPEPYFLAALKIEESPRICLSVRNPQRERTSIRLFLNSSSLINHYEESHLVYGSLESILLDQGILVKNKLDDTLSQLPTFFLYYEARSVPA